MQSQTLHSMVVTRKIPAEYKSCFTFIGDLGNSKDRMTQGSE